MKRTDYGMYRPLPGVSWEDAVVRTEKALGDEGFGVLTRIDVRETMRRKLDLEFRPYVILGACNPPLAHRALSAEDSIGLMLPCNVVVAATEDGSEVAIARPRAMMEVSDAGGLEPVAVEAEERLARVLDAI